uniref:NADH-ubiquinone oxidoreductase chain 4 n=1 Tax=Prosthiostomum siphunculus TaxID=983679 RepID=A0A0P0CFS9_9PLAT|nr:NADH dehydrogenase subunit 4 [Prosthiostomum siphunculus]ALI86958.1 NADH dehydrogenase subunit 4 [Prosthiostomum siphunculus]
MSKFIYLPFSHFMANHSHFIISDNIAGFLVLLSIWITLLMVLAMNNSNNISYLFFNFNILNLILIGAFLVDDYLCFFVFFELSLIPTLIIILSWGVQPERIRAGSYLMIYTIVGAIPLLLCIVFRYFSNGSNSIHGMIIGEDLIYSLEYSWMILCWSLAFMIKLPIYGVHLWLPKAHVEAPVAGSMILAGVLLKLGAYGLMRINEITLMWECRWSGPLFIWLLYSMCMVGLICFRQSDLKSLVAYSSVAHMSLVMLGFYCFDYVGSIGVLGMLVAHGICSSGLFFGVQCFYESSGSRSIILNRGFLNMSPLLCFFWLILCVANASAPPSLNLVSEFFLISSILNYSNFSGVFCFLSVFLAGLFSIYLYVLTSHGKWSMFNNFWGVLNSRQSLIFLLHSIPLYGLILLSNNLLPI